MQRHNERHIIKARETLPGDTFTSHWQPPELWGSVVEATSLRCLSRAHRDSSEPWHLPVLRPDNTFAKHPGSDTDSPTEEPGISETLHLLSSDWQEERGSPSSRLHQPSCSVSDSLPELLISRCNCLLTGTFDLWNLNVSKTELFVFTPPILLHPQPLHLYPFLLWLSFSDQKLFSHLCLHSSIKTQIYSVAKFHRLKIYPHSSYVSPPWMLSWRSSLWHMWPGFLQWPPNGSCCSFYPFPLSTFTVAEEACRPGWSSPRSTAPILTQPSTT